MTALAIQEPLSLTETKAPRIVSLESFWRLYSNRKDGNRYEWNNGIVEKTTRPMNRSQLRIVQILSRLFIQTQAFAQMGELEREVVMFLPKAKRNRVADLAYLTAQQVLEKEDLRPSLAAFVVEIISKNDKADDISEKLEQYFDNGVQVVWHIYPKLQKVEVYTSPNDVVICRGETIVSAAPVLLDFSLAAKDIFK